MPPLEIECYKAIIDVEVTSRGTSILERAGYILEALNGHERGISEKSTPTSKLFDEIYDIRSENGFTHYPAWINFRLAKKGKNGVIARFHLLPLELAWKLEVMTKEYESRLRLLGNNRTSFKVVISQTSFKVNDPIYRDLFTSIVEGGMPTSQIEGGNFLSIPIVIKDGVKSIPMKIGLRLTKKENKHSCNLEFTLSDLLKIEDIRIPEIPSLNIKNTVDIGDEKWLRSISTKLQPIFLNIHEEIEQWTNTNDIELPKDFKKLKKKNIVLVNRFPIISEVV